MARLGMDVDQVENAGRALKDRAVAIDNVVAAIDKTVKTLPSVWEGPDAQKFVNVWWPEHRKQLVAAGTTVAGLGQSALNNASEQRQASGQGGPGSSSNTPISHVIPAGPNAALGGADSATPHSTEGTLAPGGLTDAYRQYRDSTQHWTGKYWDDGSKQILDGNNMAVDNCTSWADFRRHEIDPGLPIATGNGGQMAGNLGGSPSTPPTLGALASYYPGDSPQLGHVMVVEGISSTNPPTIHISEMNYAGSSDVHTRVLTQRSDGNWYGDGMGPNGYPITFSA